MSIQKEFKKKVKEIEKIRDRITKDRDRLAEIISEIEEIEQSVTYGIDGIGEGLVFFNHALQDMSLYI